MPRPAGSRTMHDMTAPDLVPALGHARVLGEGLGDARRSVGRRAGRGRGRGVGLRAALRAACREGVIAIRSGDSGALVPFLLDALLERVHAAGLVAVRFVFETRDQRQTAERLVAIHSHCALRRGLHYISARAAPGPVHDARGGGRRREHRLRCAMAPGAVGRPHRATMSRAGRGSAKHAGRVPWGALARPRPATRPPVTMADDRADHAAPRPARRGAGPRALYGQLRCGSAAVRVVEQQCIYLDLDGRDLEPGCVLWWHERGGEVLSTIRVLAQCEERVIGRRCDGPGQRAGSGSPAS